MPEPSCIDVSFADGITNIVVSGALTVQEVTTVIQAHYPTLASPLVLWNLTLAEIGTITENDFMSIALAARAVSSPGQSRKTAYVVADAPDYMTLCKYLNVTLGVRMPVEYSVFTDVAGAIRWLKGITVE